MHLLHERRGEVAIIRVEGELDLNSAERFRNELELALSAGARKLWLDLSEVTFIDSSGLGVLMGRYKRIQERDGELAVIGPSPSLLRILKMSGLLQIVQIYASQEQAEAAG